METTIKPDSLTPRQREIYEFIRSEISDRGYGPTVREIGDQFGIKSQNGVMLDLKSLEKQGFISRESKLARSTDRLHGDEESPDLPPQAVDLIVELAKETRQNYGRVAHVSAELYRLALEAKKRGERLAFVDASGNIVQEVNGLLPEDDDDLAAS